jgi:hypothetical protein
MEPLTYPGSHLMPGYLFDQKTAEADETTKPGVEKHKISAKSSTPKEKTAENSEEDAAAKKLALAENPEDAAKKLAVAENPEDAAKKPAVAENPEDAAKKLAVADEKRRKLIEKFDSHLAHLKNPDMEPWYINHEGHKRELELMEQERLEDDHNEIQGKNLQQQYQKEDIRKMSKFASHDKNFRQCKNRDEQEKAIEDFSAYTSFGSSKNASWEVFNTPQCTGGDSLKQVYNWAAKTRYDASQTKFMFEYVEPYIRQKYGGGSSDEHEHINFSTIQQYLPFRGNINREEQQIGYCDMHFNESITTNSCPALFQTANVHLHLHKHVHTVHHLHHYSSHESNETPKNSKNFDLTRKREVVPFSISTTEISIDGMKSFKMTSLPRDFRRCLEMFLLTTSAFQSRAGFFEEIFLSLDNSNIIKFILRATPNSETLQPWTLLWFIDLESETPLRAVASGLKTPDLPQNLIPHIINWRNECLMNLKMQGLQRPDLYH